MSVGEIIKCSGLDDAMIRREALMNAGYSVDLVYEQRQAVLIITEVPENGTGV